MQINQLINNNLLKENQFKDNNIFDDNIESKSFSSYLKDILDGTNTAVIKSEKLSEDFALGRTDNIHEVLVAAEKADIALQFTMQIRNKILDAYNEIMRMQI